MRQNPFSYDLTIRTTGRGGVKYSLLLKSIQALTHQPDNIYIILPYGVQPPPEKLGYEQFVYADKGMISQRIAAFQYCTADYILFCDDDLAFSPDFVEKLYKGIETEHYDFAVGEALAMLPAEHGIKHFIPIITAAGAPTIFHKDRYVSILRSSGWSYTRFMPEAGKVLPTDSAAGVMFFARAESMKKLDFSAELWAQHDGLAPAEDQIMFYKANCLGMKVCVVEDAHYDHLDAKNSTATKESIEKKQYWSGFNRYVFWHRFIFLRERNAFGRALARTAFGYYRFAGLFYRLISSIIKHEKLSMNHSFGMKAAKKYIKSEEYRRLAKLPLKG